MVEKEHLCGAGGIPSWLAGGWNLPLIAEKSMRGRRLLAVLLSMARGEVAESSEESADLELHNQCPPEDVGMPMYKRSRPTA